MYNTIYIIQQKITEITVRPKTVNLQTPNQALEQMPSPEGVQPARQPEPLKPQGASCFGIMVVLQ